MPKGSVKVSVTAVAIPSSVKVHGLPVGFVKALVGLLIRICGTNRVAEPAWVRIVFNGQGVGFR